MADPESGKTSNWDADVQYWKDLFDKFTNKDEENCVVKISDLEEAVKGINSRDLRTDYNIQDFQLKR